MRLHSALLASAFTLTALAGQAQLLPAGEFAARDGRPGPGLKWSVSDAQGARLAADINAIAAATPIVIDYDHQTLRAEDNGQVAPAAGWIQSVEWRKGEGLFATVEWTAAAKARIDGGEYRYISPVIQFDETGAVTGVLLAALVNHPALLGMEPVIAQLAAQFSSHQQEASRMSLLASLIVALGLPTETTEASALTALTSQITAAKAKPALPAPLVVALGLQAGADEAAALSAIAALKTPDASMLQTVTALQAQVALLNSNNIERTVTELVEGAIKAGKFAPASRDTLLSAGRKDSAWLTAHIAAAPVIPGLNGQSKTDGHDSGVDGSNLNANDLAAKAKAYQIAQLAAGITLDAAQAVTAVMAGAK